MPLEALIFDVDGTLAETEELHRHAFNETFERFGLPWRWDRPLYGQLLKITGGKERMHAHAASIGEEIDSALVAEIHREKTLRYGALMAQGEIALRPGIRSLIDAARGAGIRLAIATTTNRPNVDALVRATFGREAETVFSAIAAGDEVAHKKPAPDVYQLALKRLDVPTQRCLALEDSANGVRSAVAASLAVAACPSAYTQGEDFSGAAAVLGSFEEIAAVPDAARVLATFSASA